MCYLCHDNQAKADIADLTQRLRETEEDLKLANSTVEGVSTELSKQQSFGDAVAAEQFDRLLNQTRAEYTSRIHNLEAHARQLEAALGEGDAISRPERRSTHRKDSINSSVTSFESENESNAERGLRTQRTTENGTQTHSTSRSVGVQATSSAAPQTGRSPQRASEETLASASTALSAA